MSSALSRSSADPLSDALDAAVTVISAEILRVAAANPVVLIDGRSGAGKTSLARLLVARWPQRGRVQSVGLDSLYPGWDGLEAGSEYARSAILVPHARGMIGVWERWDWDASQRAEAHAVDPSLPLIVEGSGILTPASAKLSDVRVWVEAPAASRKRRGLERDGETYRPHWDRWARQESEHAAKNCPEQRATIVIALP